MEGQQVSSEGSKSNTVLDSGALPVGGSVHDGWVWDDNAEYTLWILRQGTIFSLQPFSSPGK